MGIFGRGYGSYTGGKSGGGLNGCNGLVTWGGRNGVGAGRSGFGGRNGFGGIRLLKYKEVTEF